MKKLFALSLLLASPSFAQLLINTNPGTADTAPQAGSKINTNFTSVYSTLASLSPLTNEAAYTILCNPTSAPAIASDCSSLPPGFTVPASILTGTVQPGQAPALTGDVIATGGTASTTVVKVNGGAIPTSASLVGTNVSGQLQGVTLGTNLSLTGSTLNAAGGSGSSAFNALTSGTNTTAAMVVGSGGSLAPSGTGTIAATSIPQSSNASQLLYNVVDFGAKLDGVTDDSAALVAAVTAVNNAWTANTTRACIYIPATHPTMYLNGASTMIPFSRYSPGCVIGDGGEFKSVIQLGSAFVGSNASAGVAGDLFAWSDTGPSSIGGNPPYALNSPLDSGGPTVRNLTVFGYKGTSFPASSSIQNAFMMYDITNFAFFDNVGVFWISGQAIMGGRIKNNVVGFIQESMFNNVRINKSGNTTLPVPNIEILGDCQSTCIGGTTADYVNGPNQIDMTNIRIYSAEGTGLKVWNNNPNSGANSRKIRIANFSVEGDQSQSSPQQTGYLLQLGDPNAVGTLNSFYLVNGSFVTPYDGYGDVLLTGYNSTPSATGSTISGTTLTLGTITGTFKTGLELTGTGVTAGTLIVSGSGSTWTVTPSQTVASTTITGQGAGPQWDIRCDNCAIEKGAGANATRTGTGLGLNIQNGYNVLWNGSDMTSPSTNVTIGPTSAGVGVHGTITIEGQAQENGFTQNIDPTAAPYVQSVTYKTGLGAAPGFSGTQSGSFGGANGVGLVGGTATFTDTSSATGPVSGSYWLYNLPSATVAATNTGVDYTGTIATLHVPTPTLGTNTTTSTAAVRSIQADSGINTAGLLSGQLGASINGATIAFNASSNFDVNINTGTSTGTTTLGNSLSKLVFGAVPTLPNYTVATLPTCATATKYQIAAVTDATSPTYNGTLTGGGTVVIPVFCNGTAWTAH